MIAGADARLRALHFGAEDRPLFGVHHRPLRERATPAAAVICAPFGHDAVRGHRGLRQLAAALAHEGIHALRFDLSGTGDSWGEGTDATLEGWRADAALALDELRELSGVERLAVVGVGLGALVGALAAAAHPRAERVVLFEPVVRGAAYLEELAREQAARLRSIAAYVAPGEALARGHDGSEALGFPLPPRLREELRLADLREMQPGALRRAAIFLEAGAPGEEAGALALALRGRGVEATVERAPALPAAAGAASAGPASRLPTAVEAIVRCFS